MESLPVYKSLFVSRIRTIARKEKLKSFDKVPLWATNQMERWCCFIFILSFGVGIERQFSSLKTSDVLNQPKQSILCGTVAL